MIPSREEIIKDITHKILTFDRRNGFIRSGSGPLDLLYLDGEELWVLYIRVGPYSIERESYRTLQLASLDLHESIQRKGIMSAVINNVKEFYDAILLECCHTEGSQGLALKNGFTEDANLEHNYYLIRNVSENHISS